MVDLCRRKPQIEFQGNYKVQTAPMTHRCSLFTALKSVEQSAATRLIFSNYQYCMSKIYKNYQIAQIYADTLVVIE